jgi:prepilin-type N-terminal cleavage/methylation domain-containing protein/prepilin-type processing-associated H-X9-DG protein
MLHPTECRGRARGFTLVELMVTVSIIALLIGLMLPGLGMVRASARASKSMSNLRQWGTGTIGYCNMNGEALPWEGLKDANSMATNLATSQYWANAVPPLVGQRPYSDICERAFQEQRDVEHSGDAESIFLDPAARPESEQPWGFGSPGPGGFRHEFYFNYVPNSQLNNTMQKSAGLPDYSPTRTMHLSHIPFSDRTILMLEMRANPNELAPSDPYYGKDLNRHRSDWKRFAARHFKGGHMMFADGHVAWVLNEEATTNSQGSRDPSYPNGDWNSSKLIWDPLGPALDDN